MAYRVVQLRPLVHLHCPRCRCVGTTAKERYQSIQCYVRPEEMARFVRWPRYPQPSIYTPAAGVAAAMRLAFASGELSYISDPEGCDRWCPPSETIRRGGGDCDDLAILAASWLLACGTSAYVVTGNFCDGWVCDGHAWVEGVDQYGWFLLEATAGTVHRRERPQGYEAQLLLGPGVCEAA